MKALVLFLALACWLLPYLATAASKDETDRRIARAEELFEQGRTDQAKQICEGILGALPDQPSAQRASALNVMSKIYASDGDYDRAIAAARQSAEEFEHVSDPEGEAHALNNKGIAEIQTGAYGAARLDLEKALTLSRTSNDLENQVQISNNLGSAFYFRGSYEESMRSYDRALVLVNANASAQWSDYWLQLTKFNQATLFQRLGRYTLALRIYREVEASSKTLTPGDRAHLYANLGTLYRRLGDPYKALETFQAAQQLYSKQHDSDGEIAVLKNIGIVYALDLEELARAGKLFRLALALAEKTHNRREEMQAHLYLGETLLRSLDLTGARKEFEKSRSLAGELSTTEDRWKSLYGLGRIEEQSGNPSDAEQDYRQAVSLIEGTRTQLQLSALRSEFFADKREAYDALISLLFRKKDLKEAFLFMEKSRSRNFQDRMQAHSDETPTAPSLDETRAKLPPATALLEFWTSRNLIGLIWSTRESSGLELRYLSAEEETGIQRILEDLPGSLDGSPQAATAPLNLIFPDHWPLPPGIDHLLIVPDAWISYIPFDLLHPAGVDTRLIELCDISYLPSAGLLSRSRRDSRPGWPWTRQLVAFGDPTVDAQLSDNDTKNPDQGPHKALPYSSREIEDIANLAPGSSRLFLRQEDLKTYFRNGNANTGIVLHVSTHALADVDNPEGSRLLFSPDTVDSGPAYLFLREIYDLDLSHVRLATISACDTERGKIIRGEGVQAFSRALLSAGAESSVTTLWRVDDQPTAEFMKQFYFYLMRQNKPKAEALRLAKLKFLNSKSKLDSPSVWAAFVLNGDGLTPIPRLVTWTEIVLSGTGVVVLLAFVVAWRTLRAHNPRAFSKP